MADLPGDEEVRAAREILARHLPVTRMVGAPGLTRRLGSPIWLKLDSELPTGSFKVRGALYALAHRMARETVREVVASSTGNHGAAVAFAASLVGLPATIFLPENPNPIKRARIAQLGASILEQGMADLTEAGVAARDYAAARGAYYLDDATDPDLPAGPATIAAEIFEQAPEIRSLFIPVGDSALIRGVAAEARRRQPDVRVVGVVAAGAPSYFLSWIQGRPVPTDTFDTIADGLAIRTPRAASVEALRSAVDEVVLVTDDDMLAAMRLLLLEEHVVAEPAGAAAVAAALAAGSLDRPTALLVSGANLSPAHLAALGRLGEP